MRLALTEVDAGQTFVYKQLLRLPDARQKMDPQLAMALQLALQKMPESGSPNGGAGTSGIRKGIIR